MSFESPKSPPEAREDYSSPEKELPATRCLIVLGGGISKVQIKGDEKPRWKVARYVMPRKKGEMARENLRGPFRRDEDLSDPERFFGAGGNAHLLGAIQYIEETRARGKTPEHVILAAGLSRSTTGEAPDFNEGAVLEETLKRRLPDMAGIEARGRNSSNTEGDLINGLSAAKEYGLSEALVLLTDLRMERTKLMCEKVQREHPELSDISVSFISAEDLLRRRYAGHPDRARKLEMILKTLHGSEMGRRIAEMEKAGVAKLKEGGYRPLGH